MLIKAHFQLKNYEKSAKHLNKLNLKKIEMDEEFADIVFQVHFH